jgi:hypothetical protein
MEKVEKPLKKIYFHSLKEVVQSNNLIHHNKYLINGAEKVSCYHFSIIISGERFHILIGC